MQGLGGSGWTDGRRYVYARGWSWVGKALFGRVLGPM